MLIFFGNGLNPLWPLMWLAMLPVLWFSLRSSWSSAAIVAAASMLLGCFNMWHYLHGVLGIPAPVWFLFVSFTAIVFAGAVLLFRALVRRRAFWSALVALPAVWVSLEYSRNFTTPHGSAGSLAYSQLQFLPFLQLASITGPWGMTFVLLLFPSAIVIALYLWPVERRRAVQIASAGLGLVALVLTFGAIRLMQPQGKTSRIGLISSDQPPYAMVSEPGAPTEQLFRAYAAEVERLAAQGAQAIVLPEKLGVLIDPNTSQADTLFQSTADKTGATVIVGAVHVAAPFTYNEARVYSPHVAVAGYEKQHMLPPFESNLKPGTTLTVLPRPQQTWGVAICKDMDFAQPARRYGVAGVGILLVPAWDFNIDRSWHGHIAVMRGVEDGFSIARSAKGGYMTVSDSRGRIVAEVRSDSAPFVTLLVDVPVEHHSTPYLLLGDWFAWFALLVLVLVLTGLFRTRRTEN
jgi:apolipoprotein N-acyltransferase